MLNFLQKYNYKPTYILSSSGEPKNFYPSSANSTRKQYLIYNKIMKIEIPNYRKNYFSQNNLNASLTGHNLLLNI